MHMLERTDCTSHTSEEPYIGWLWEKVLSEKNHDSQIDVAFAHSLFIMYLKPGYLSSLSPKRELHAGGFHELRESGLQRSMA